MDIENTKEDLQQDQYHKQKVKANTMIGEDDSHCKQTSAETNDCSCDEAANNIHFNMSHCEIEEGTKRKHLFQLEAGEQGESTYQPLLQKRTHANVNKDAVVNKMNSEMVSENEEQLNETTRKQVKASGQCFGFQTDNGEVSYDPICLNNQEDEKLKNDFQQASVMIFSNENINTIFASQKDSLVIQNDVPERYQLLLGNLCENISQNEMDYLVKFIFSSLSMQDKSEITLREVENVLNLILKQKMEILTIWNNEKNFIPNVKSLETLWKIFNLVIYYKDELYFPRSKYDDVTIEMYSIRQISEVVSFYMNIAQNKKDFNDIYLYFNYLKCCFGIKSRQTSEIQANYLKIINQTREYNIPTTINQYFEESSSCAENLLPIIYQMNPLVNLLQKSYTPSQNSSMSLELSSISSEENLISEVYKNQKDISLSEKAQSDLMQDYICLDFFFNPIIKKYIVESYYKHAVLSTSPQSHVIDFNLYHEYFSAKKIVKKPLNQIKSEEYLTIIQAVQINIIDCKIQLTWQANSGEDLIYKELEPYFQSKLAQQSDKLKVFVQNLLQKLLKNYFYPYAQNEMKKMLEEKSLAAVRNSCVEKFKEYISYGPYLTKDRQDKLAKPETILSFYVNEASGMIGVSMVNQSGKEVYKNSLEYYYSSDKTVAQKKEQEIKNIFEFIRNRQPHVMIVSSNSTKSVILKQNLTNLFKSTCRTIVMADQSMMNCFMQQSTLIQSQKDKYIFLARKQAKSFQFRLSEVCQVWNYENNPILDINFHPFQKKLDRKDLQIRFEEVIQERICHEGLDFKNLFDKSSYERNFLQFVPGFGPRKSYFFLSQLDLQKDPKEVNSRLKCIQLNLMNQNLQMNSLSFLKFLKSDNPLDQTKIPFKQYFIAKNIIGTLESCEKNQQNIHIVHQNNDNQINKNESEYLRILTQKGQMLNQLDVNDYSKQLEKKFKRQNMVLVLNKIIDELSRIQTSEELTTIAPEMTLEQVFKSIYKSSLNSIRKGAILKLRLRDIDDKYFEFMSVDYKIITRLMKSDIPKSLNLERFFQRKKSADIELILDSLSLFENRNVDQNQTDSIFDNKLTFTYPDYNQLIKELVPELNQPNQYFGEIDQSDLPYTITDLKDQFNIFLKEMDKNPNNVIDLTEDISQQNKGFNQNNSNTGGWNDSSTKPTSSNNNSQSSWGDSNNKSDSNAKDGWGSTNNGNTQQDPSEKPLRNGGGGGGGGSSSWGGQSSNNDSSQFRQPRQPVRENNQGDRPLRNNGGGQSSFGGSSNKSESNTDGWGSSGNNNSSQNQSGDTGGWGSTASQSSKVESSSSNGGWGTTDQSSSQEQSNTGGWGSSTTSSVKQDTSNNNDGWGGSTSNAQVDSWGSSNESGQNNSSGNDGGSGWGDSSASSGWGGGGSSGQSGQQQNRNQSNRREGGNGGNGGGGSRACFKCGKEGHMSRDCTEPNSNQGKKGCFKCGKEGHMSKDCTEPQQNKRPGGNACFKCNQEGHMSRDCPNPSQQKKGSCFKCGEEGHMSRECTNPPKPREGGGGGGDGQRKKGCFKCGEEGHMSKDCTNPNQKKTSCFKCGEEGHMSRECTNPPKPREGGGERKKGCFNCGDEGHMSKDCTQERKPRQFDRNRNNNNNSFGKSENNSFGGSSSGGGAWGNDSGNAWGSSSDTKEGGGESTSSGWGSSSNNDTKNNQSSGGWGSTDTSTKNNDTGGWGSSDNKKASSNEGSGGWGSTANTAGGW